MTIATFTFSRYHKGCHVPIASELRFPVAEEMGAAAIEKILHLQMGLIRAGFEVADAAKSRSEKGTSEREAKPDHAARKAGRPCLSAPSLLMVIGDRKLTHGQLMVAGCSSRSA